MTGNEYQQAALRTINRDLTMGEQTANACFGLAGEVGEFLDLLKKAMFQDHPLEVSHLIKELGDISWYLALACTVFDIDLDDVFEANIEKLKERYPEGFDTEKSQHRREDDVW